MAFDDRHAEWMSLLVCFALATAIGSPIAGRLGLRGIGFWLSIVGCFFTTWTVLIVVLNVRNIAERLSKKNDDADPWHVAFQPPSILRHLSTHAAASSGL